MLEAEVEGGCITEGTSVNLQIIYKEECLSLSAAVAGPRRLCLKL